MSDPAGAGGGGELPRARVERGAGPGDALARSLAWGLPLAALALAAFLGRTAWSARGTLVRVQAEAGHGIGPGDPLRYRGIRVGEVMDVRLAGEGGGVELEVRLAPEAGHLARSGSRFWVVRPQISLEGIEGLETIVGARYLAVAPGLPGGERLTDFVALPRPPVLEERSPLGLEIILEAPDRFGLVAGAPLTYRGIRVGTVLSVRLASDATSVEARTYVRPGYTSVVREDTRFYCTGGLEARFRLTGGFSLELESAQALLLGGVGLATPEDPGAEVLTGHRFALHADAEEPWLRWRPRLSVGPDRWGGDGPLPVPYRARRSWSEGRFLRRGRAVHGWILPTELGCLAPEELLAPGDDEGSGRLEVEGAVLELPAQPIRRFGGVALAGLVIPERDAWPSGRMRAPTGPEDCLLVGDPALEPVPVAQARLLPEDGAWRLVPSFALDEGWHGASVVARSDGALIGVVRVAGGAGMVVPLPGDL